MEIQQSLLLMPPNYLRALLNGAIKGDFWVDIYLWKISTTPLIAIAIAIIAGQLSRVLYRQAVMGIMSTGDKLDIVEAIPAGANFNDAT